MSKNKKVNPYAKKIVKPICKPDRTIRKEKVDWYVTELSENDMAMPIDYTFHKYTEINDFDPENVRRSRFGKIERGDTNKYLSRTLWLNHNYLCNSEHVDKLVKSVVEHPERLAFLDLSHNYFKVIDNAILTLQSLKILYLHDNRISDINEVFKLRQLKLLHNLTLYGNPLYDNTGLGNTRAVVRALLPKIRKLDYFMLTGIEIAFAINPMVKRFIEIKEGRLPPYIPTKAARLAYDRERAEAERNNRGKYPPPASGNDCPNLKIEKTKKKK